MVGASTPHVPRACSCGIQAHARHDASWPNRHPFPSPNRCACCEHSGHCPYPKRLAAAPCPVPDPAFLFLHHQNHRPNTARMSMEDAHSTSSHLGAHRCSIVQDGARRIVCASRVEAECVRATSSVHATTICKLIVETHFFEEKRRRKE